MKRSALIFFVASLPAACGGGGPTPSPPASQPPAHTLQASPSSINVNLLSGSPVPYSIAITSPSKSALSGLQWSATDLSFFSASLQQGTATAATLNVTVIGAGNSSVTVRDSTGDSVAIPITSIPCGRPDLLSNAQLIFPAKDARNVPLTTSAYFIEVAVPLQPSPPSFPTIHAHFVVNGTTTIDPPSPLAVATAPPNAVFPTPLPGPFASGIESGAMPQLAAGDKYTLYIYDDTCEIPWNAGSFST